MLSSSFKVVPCIAAKTSLLASKQPASVCVCVHSILNLMDRKFSEPWHNAICICTINNSTFPFLFARILLCVVYVFVTHYPYNLVDLLRRHNGEMVCATELQKKKIFADEAVEESTKCKKQQQSSTQK